MSGDEDNTIRIRTEELSVEFSGPAPRVQQSYMSLRHVLLEAFETTMQQQAAGEPGRSKTMQMHDTDPSQPSAVDDGDAPDDDETVDSGEAADGGEASMSAAVRAMAPDPDEGTAAVIQLVLRRPNYTKVRLLERSELANSFLGKGLDASAIRRLYASPETAEYLHETLTIGGTLWRKLTPAGRREVARRSESSSEETDE